MNQEIQNQIEADEINITDYIRIIRKRKWLILGIFLTVLIGTGVFTFLLPENYKVETSLEIGIIDRHLLEDPSQVVEKIKGSIYGNYPGIKVTNPKGTNLVKTEIVSKEPEDAKEILESINKSILTGHTNKLDSQRDILKNNIELLQEKIDFLLSKGQETAILQLEIYRLQRPIEDLQPTKIVQEPTIFERPVKPNLIFNLIIAGVLGLFVGIVLALGKEWWEKNKAKI